MKTNYTTGPATTAVLAALVTLTLYGCQAPAGMYLDPELPDSRLAVIEGSELLAPYTRACEVDGAEVPPSFGTTIRVLPGQRLLCVEMWYAGGAKRYARFTHDFEAGHHYKLKREPLRIVDKTSGQERTIGGPYASSM